MTFFVWLLLAWGLYFAVCGEWHELWVVKLRLLWRRLARRGVGPTEWS